MRNKTQLARLVPESHTNDGSNTKKDVEELVASVGWPLIMKKVTRLWSRASVHQQGALTYHRSKDGSVVLPKRLSIASTLLESNDDQSRRENCHDEREDE